ncbi:MAG: metalloregulator ArsR/SmtB family transcription factor [Actinomycetota bacterium]|nr:metalloregulator ArsR/SmtB family transcription factor [Actinomycetota bacterium]
MNDALRALANPTRRAILRLVWDTERTSGDIADETGLSRPAASQHLRVLRHAGLVAVRVDAQHRWYHVRADKVDELRAALEEFWGDRLASLKAAAEAMAPTPLARPER